jgi:hypothetical protein
MRWKLPKPWALPALSGLKSLPRPAPTPRTTACCNACIHGLDQDLFTIHHTPEPILEIDDIKTFNEKEGLALSQEEIDYLNNVSVALGRKLTDSEVFGFSQVNSEHCRHKIFNGTFIIDGKEKEATLFQLIKKTSKENPNYIVSAYKDNVAFIKGPACRTVCSRLRR